MKTAREKLLKQILNAGERQSYYGAIVSKLSDEYAKLYSTYKKGDFVMVNGKKALVINVYFNDHGFRYSVKYYNSDGTPAKYKGRERANELIGEASISEKITI